MKNDYMTARERLDLPEDKIIDPMLEDNARRVAILLCVMLAAILGTLALVIWSVAYG